MIFSGLACRQRGDRPHTILAWGFALSPGPLLLMVRHNMDMQTLLPARVLITGTIVSGQATVGQYGITYTVVIQEASGRQVQVTLPKTLDREAYDQFTKWAEDAGEDVIALSEHAWFCGTEDGRYPGVQGRRLSLVATVPTGTDEFVRAGRPTNGKWLYTGSRTR